MGRFNFTCERHYEALMTPLYTKLKKVTFSANLLTQFPCLLFLSHIVNPMYISY